MLTLARPDGAEIGWRLDGEDGPLVVVSVMALHPPAAARPVVEELARDHRVVTYDLRGTGASSRTPPYDVETDASDLAALVEEAGGDALALALGDGARRAVRVAAERPDLVHTVVISGEMPLGRGGHLATEQALSGSAAVIGAMLGMLETDYRTGLHSLFASSGEPVWDEQALRERLDAIEAHCPPEVGVARMRSWTEDDSTAAARSLGDRLWCLHYAGNAWFQGSLETLRRDLPEANFEEVSEGVISSPRENADALRRILAAVRT